jgi:hypothetical protein
VIPTHASVLLAVAAVLGLSACGPPGPDDDAAGGVPVEQTPPAGVAELPADTGALPGGDPTVGPATDRAARPGTTPPAPAPGSGGQATPASPRPSAPSQATPPAADTSEPLRGRIRVSGTAQEPITTIAVDGVGPLIVTGRHETDLRTLSGAVVAVRGAQAGVQRRTIDVTAYEILEIDGARPVVGRILQDGRLDTGADTLSLTGATADMRRGARVWVVGERVGSTLRVSSAGRIGVQ